MLFTAKQWSDNYSIEEKISGYYEEPQIEFDKPPQFSLTVPNKDGIEMYRLTPGKEVKIYRAGQLGIHGIIDDPAGDQGGGAMSKVEAGGIHLGYSILQGFECHDWSYAESGSTSDKVRSAVIINPWDWFIFRAPDGPLNIDGLTQAIDGVSVDDAIRCCIGTKAIWQIDFQDNEAFLPSTISVTTNTAQVYRDGASGQTRSAFQPVRNGSAFKSAAASNQDSIPFQQNNPDASAMGAIGVVNVLLVGEKDASHNPIIYVCRNAALPPASRSYSGITLAHTANYLGSGLDAWTGSFNLGGGVEHVKNSLGFRLSVNETAPYATATAVYYAKISASVDTETGIYEGAIAAYSNPSTYYGGGHNWVEASVQGFDRLKAIETLRKMTYSDPAVNPNPHWDAWISTDDVNNFMQVNFAQRRGAVVAHTISFPAGNMKKIRHEYDSKELAYHTIGIGAGSGSARNLISAKGRTLYDSDRDPKLPDISLRDSTATDADLVYLGISATARTSPQAKYGQGFGMARAGYLQLLDATPNTALKISGDLSIAMAFELDDVVNTQILVGFGAVGETSQENLQYLFGVTSTGAFLYLHENGAGVNNQITTAGGVVSSGFHTLTLRRDSTAKTLTVKLDGAVIINAVGYANNADGGVDTDNNTMGRLHIGHDPGGEVTTMSGAMHQFAIKSGALVAQATLDAIADPGDATTAASSGVAWTALWEFDAQVRLYGKKARQISFTDSNERSLLSLLRKTEAHHKLHRDPIEKITAEMISEDLPYFATGDSVTIDNMNTRTSAGQRAIYIKRAFSGSNREQLTVNFGQPETTIFDRSNSNRNEAKTLTVRPIPTNASVGLSGNGIYFDKDHYGVLQFPIDDGAIVDKVFLRLSTQPWQATSRTGKIPSGTTSEPQNTMAYGYADNNTVGPANVANNGALAANVTHDAAAAYGSVIAATVTANGGGVLDGVMVITNVTLAATLATFPVHAGTAADNTATFTHTELAGFLQGDAIRATWTNRSGGVVNTTVSLVVYGLDAHTHSFALADLDVPLTFGIFQFDGDGGDGSGDPVYGINVKFAVDPDVQTTGLPDATDFSNKQHPQIFAGSQTAPTDIDVEITGYVAQSDDNDSIRSGIHKVFFQSAAAASNALGLTVVSAVPIVKLKQGAST